MKRRVRDRFLMVLMAICILLPSCTTGLQVTLASSQEQLPSPSFKIAERRQKNGPRFDTVTVLDQQDEVVWKLRAEPFRLIAQVPTLMYGEAPTGFTTLVGPQELESGASYRLIVEGKAVGGLTFKTDPTGAVSVARKR